MAPLPDARLDNVLCVETSPVWIDFVISILPPVTCVREKFNEYNASRVVDRYEKVSIVL